MYKKNFRIPDSVISNKDMGKVRVALYSYLYIHKGLNDIVNFSVPMFLDWIGMKSDSHDGKINDKVLNALDLLSDAGYITFNKFTKTSYGHIKFNTQLVNDECNGIERFAIVYIDEVESILSYKNKNVKDTSINSMAIMLVFAYLRKSIPRRSNLLNPEECSTEGVLDRQKRIPEAYNAKFIDIASALGLSERTVSKAVDVLRARNLIVLGTPYRIKCIDGEYRTPDFIFSNFDKRDRGDLLVSGMEYAKAEIKIKADKMNEYYKQFGINYYIKDVS